MRESVKKEELVYSITNNLGHNRCIFKSYGFDHYALADYVGEAMSGAFKQWYSKKDLVADLRATADLIEKLEAVAIRPLKRLKRV